MTQSERLMLNQRILSLLPGDEFYINNWREPMIVAGRSRHFIVAYNPHFNEKEGAYEYTVIPVPESIGAPVPRCGPDDWIFGFISKTNQDIGHYTFDDPVWVAEYLQSFESGKSHISRRNSAQISRIRKSKEWLNG